MTTVKQTWVAGGALRHVFPYHPYVCARACSDNRGFGAAMCHLPPNLINGCKGVFEGWSLKPAQLRAHARAKSSGGSLKMAPNAGLAMGGGES